MQLAALTYDGITWLALQPTVVIPPDHTAETNTTGLHQIPTGLGSGFALGEQLKNNCLSTPYFKRQLADLKVEIWNKSLYSILSERWRKVQISTFTAQSLMPK